jgi:ZIP family zinc transporter
MSEPSSLWTVLPPAVVVVAGFLTLLLRPGKKLTSAMQHLCAGLIISAVAVELLPKSIGEGHSVYYAAGGYLIGLVIVFSIRVISRRLDEESPAGLLASVAIDISIDALLVGIAAATLAGLGAGVVAGSLSLEVGFLVMATASTLLARKWSKTRVLLAAFVMALITLGLGMGGFYASSVLPPHILTGVTGLGVAALLYLVVEELLVEAHSDLEGETSFGSMLFFIGFGVPTILAAH